MVLLGIHHWKQTTYMSNWLPKCYLNSDLSDSLWFIHHLSSYGYTTWEMNDNHNPWVSAAILTYKQ